MHEHGFEDTKYFATQFTIHNDWDYKWFEKKYPNSSSKLYVNLIFSGYGSGLDVHMFQSNSADGQQEEDIKKQMEADFKKVRTEISQKFKVQK
jgi:hypothetical protein